MNRALQIIGIFYFAMGSLWSLEIKSDTAIPYAGVAYSIEDSKKDEVKAAGEDIAREFGINLPKAMPHNPVCCVWLEIRSSPDPPGYVIIHQSFGTVIFASNPEQLSLAAKRFIGSAVVREGRKEVPIGLMTNYKVIDTGIRQAEQASSP